MPERFVIIGNGPAANSAADVLRAAGGNFRITLISDEFFHYYYKHLLVDFAAGGREEAGLLVNPPLHYQQSGFRLRLGQTVVKADLKERVLYLAHLEKVHYDHLLICTGGRPRIPEVLFGFRKSFTVLKTLGHARHWRRILPGCGHLLIIGGDLVSVRIAEALACRGKKITFLADREAFWPLELSDGLRAEFADRLTGKGIDVLFDDYLGSVEPHPAGGYLVLTRNRQRIVCDLIGAFFGLVPDVEFLLGSGLDIDRGILVNEFLETSVPGVFAAGDCAQVYNPEIHNYWVSIGWPNAEHLGAIAARNLLGSKSRAGLADACPVAFESVAVTTSWWRQLG